jgi:hypothetical protein
MTSGLCKRGLGWELRGRLTGARGPCVGVAEWGGRFTESSYSWAKNIRHQPLCCHRWARQFVSQQPAWLYGCGLGALLQGRRSLAPFTSAPLLLSTSLLLGLCKSHSVVDTMERDLGKQVCRCPHPCSLGCCPPRCPKRGNSGTQISPLTHQGMAKPLPPGWSG